MPVAKLTSKRSSKTGGVSRQRRSKPVTDAALSVEAEDMPQVIGDAPILPLHSDARAFEARRRIDQLREERELRQALADGFAEEWFEISA